MQIFCPLCSKNGINKKIKAFQLNFSEAVFMCSDEKCTWPVGYQELTYINRSVGKIWSNSWEKLTDELNLKNYNVADKTDSDSLPALTEDNTHVPDEISTTLSKPRDLSLDSNFNNRMTLVSQFVDSKLSNCKLGILSENQHTNNDTSLDNKCVSDNTNKSMNDTSVLKNGSAKLNISLKQFNQTLKKVHPYKRFSLNDLHKAKSKNSNNGIKHLFSNELISNNKNQNNFNSNLKSHSENLETTRNDELDFNLDELLKGYCNDIKADTDLQNTDDYEWLDSLC